MTKKRGKKGEKRSERKCKTKRRITRTQNVEQKETKKPIYNVDKQKVAINQLKMLKKRNKQGQKRGQKKAQKPKEKERPKDVT